MKKSTTQNHKTWLTHGILNMIHYKHHSLDLRTRGPNFCSQSPLYAASGPDMIVFRHLIEIPNQLFFFCTMPSYKNYHSKWASKEWGKISFNQNIKTLGYCLRKTSKIQTYRSQLIGCNAFGMIELSQQTSTRGLWAFYDHITEGRNYLANRIWLLIGYNRGEVCLAVMTVDYIFVETLIMMPSLGQQYTFSQLTKL